MKVFGYKDMEIGEVARSVDGASRAILMQRVLFVMELLTNENLNFWFKYAGDMKACVGLIPLSSDRKSAIETAIKGFTNGLDMASAPTASVYVVYSTLDLPTVGANNVLKEVNIQMCMTVTTSAWDLNFPAVTHMGIFRSPLLSVSNPAALPAGIKDFFKMPEFFREFYRDKTVGGISLVLHSFAARALQIFRSGRPPLWMITAPLPHMGNLLGEVGKIVAIDVSPKEPASAPSRLGMPTSLKIGTPLSVANVSLSAKGASSSSSSPKIGAPVPVTHVSLPAKSVSSSSSLSKIGAPVPVSNVSSSVKDAPSSSSSLNTASEAPPAVAQPQVGELEYVVTRIPGNGSLTIMRQGTVMAAWSQIRYPWLFYLAFNPSHKYAATFSDLRVLRELHQDIVMMGTERTLELTVVTPNPGTTTPGPHTLQSSKGTVKGTGPTNEKKEWGVEDNA